MLALESKGMTSSLQERVNTESDRVTRLTGRLFMTAQIISILWRRSRANNFESLRSVSKLLNTRILDSTKFACCSFCCRGRMLQLGQGLLVAILRKDAWASVTISLGWLYLINKTDKAEINDLADRSLHGQQKK